ncbi:MAG: SAM-dependent DNA methyltransferase [Elusimicrobia bacterium]|nr:SAM-dependent DNA methyltransferase [Elusimicrobiota bacterium]
MSQGKCGEAGRLELQADLDGRKTPQERNRLGQFATPTLLALDILRYAKQLLPRGGLRFLDPAFGTGSFFSAFRKVLGRQRLKAAVGFEIDEHYGEPSAQFWRGTDLQLQLADFTSTPAPRSEAAKFDLIICNPPYVRHHHLEAAEKLRLQIDSERLTGVKLSGLAGLYCYFMLLAHEWMARDGVAGWLIPSEFMDVNYGAAIKRYLLSNVTLLRIHRFDPNDVQFNDALVSSAVVWFKNSPPPAAHSVQFTFGGSLLSPRASCSVPVSTLLAESKWTRFPVSRERRISSQFTIADFLTIKRGIATGGNRFFIKTREEIESQNLPMRFFRPILPSPRALKSDEVEGDSRGWPILDPQLFVLNCSLREEDVRRDWPALWAYLEKGKSGVASGYLCTSRNPWYAQELRQPSPFLCTYMGRGNSKSSRPFRFILNQSQAIAANVYLLLYPRPELTVALAASRNLKFKVWRALNDIKPEVILGEGRVYGGGLHKLEPRELAKVPADEIAALIPSWARPARQADFLEAVAA